MGNDGRYAHFRDELDGIRDKDSLRNIKTISNRDSKYVTYNGRKYINLSSNDYLGLAADITLLENFYSKMNKANITDFYGAGSTSSRLLTGDFSLYTELENKITELYTSGSEKPGVKSSLVFSSVYHANVGIISSLARKGDLILSDKLNHASIIDGVRLSGADYSTYGHLDYHHLEEIISRKRGNYRSTLIISESVFSMDGDIADIKRLVEIKNRHNAILYIDEAHAIGVFGDRGLGVCESENVLGDVDIILATFGKALASMGAYALLDNILKDYLVNRMRTLIFTTALPPVIVNWNLNIMKMLESLREKREKLKMVSGKFRESLISHGLSTCGNSQIIPVIIGDNRKTVTIAEKLQERGFLLFPIRPPSVPEGSSRLRISLTANVDWDDIESIPGIIGEF